MEIRTLRNRRHPRLLWARKLHRRSERRASRQTLLEGATVLGEAIAAGIAPSDVFLGDSAYRRGRCDESLARMQAAGLQPAVYVVPDDLLTRISTLTTAQDLIAIAPLPAAGGDPAALVEDERIILLAGLQDPGNAGTILRTAVAFGFDAVWASPLTVDLFHPKVIRASAGLVFRLTVRNDVVLTAALAAAGKEAGWTVFALDAHDGVDPRAVRWPQRLALLLGSEGSGIDPALDAVIAQRVRVPTAAPVESLNVAVAAALVMYDVFRFGGIQRA